MRPAINNGPTDDRLPTSTPSQPRPAPGTRPGGLSDTDLEQQRQKQARQQRLHALEHERQLAHRENRPVHAHYLSDEAWSEWLLRSQVAWRKDDARVVEWCVSAVARDEEDDADDNDDDAELLGALREFRSAQDQQICSVGWSPGSSAGGTAVAIEWANVGARDSFYASAEASAPLTQALQRAHLQRAFAYQSRETLYGLPGQAVALPLRQGAIYEIWTVYFPRDLSASAVETIERHEGPLQMPRTSPARKRQPGEEKLYGAWRRSHGWALDDDETITYQNQPARRMIYMFLWETEESRRVYREEAVWHRTTRDGCQLTSPTDGFLYDLEELGMLGLETGDFRLVALGDVEPTV